MIHKRDRLVVAWERRRDVHAWISDNPGATMSAIKQAFPRIQAEAVRGVVRRLCSSRFVRVEHAHYWVAVNFDQPVSAARDRLRAVGLAAAPALADANKTRERRADGTYAPKPLIPHGRRYINQPCKKAPIKNQGGQGARVHHGGGYCSLMMCP